MVHLHFMQPQAHSSVMCGKVSLIVDGETKTSLRNMFSFIQRNQQNGECLTDIFKGKACLSPAQVW